MTISKKPIVDSGDFLELNPWLMVVFGEFCAYARYHGLPVVVTSIKDEAEGRKSETHEDGRAIDISSIGWSDFHIQRLSYHLNVKYSELIGTAPRGKDPIVCLHHDSGSGYHFHLQVRDFKWINRDLLDE